MEFKRVLSVFSLSCMWVSLLLLLLTLVMRSECMCEMIENRNVEAGTGRSLLVDFRSLDARASGKREKHQSRMRVQCE